MTTRAVKCCASAEPPPSKPDEVSRKTPSPVKMFPRILLDDEESVKVDGRRRVVEFLKNVATPMGLRQRDHGEKEVPRNVCMSRNPQPASAAGSSKHVEF